MASARARGFKRLSGLDRSGPPPAEVKLNEPWRVWTIPNAIGFIRLASIPPFLLLAFNDPDGRTTVTAILAGVIGFGDYFDGLTARLTGQYSRLGALLDPLIDRLVVVAGVSVCYNFELLPRWALLVLAVREIGVLIASAFAIKRGFEVRINWLGRIAVWPTMLALFVALVTDTWVSEALLYAGLVLTVLASLQYANSLWMGLPPKETAT